MRLTSCSPALGMLTFQLISLSKPVGPCKAFPFVHPYKAFGGLVGMPRVGLLMVHGTCLYP